MAKTILNRILDCIVDLHWRISQERETRIVLGQTRKTLHKTVERETLAMLKAAALEQRTERTTRTSKALMNIIYNERPYSEVPVVIIDSYGAGSLVYQNNRAEELGSFDFREVLRQIKPEVETKQDIIILGNHYGCFVDKLDVDGNPVYRLKLTSPKKSD